MLDLPRWVSFSPAPVEQESFKLLGSIVRFFPDPDFFLVSNSLWSVFPPHCTAAEIFLDLV